MESKSRQKMKPQDYDPDEFVLTRKDVEDFINIVLHYWGRTLKDKIKNIKLIAGLEMMKAGLILTDENSFKVIWSMLLHFISKLQYENAMQKALKDGENWGKTLKKLKSDLRDGGLEKMFARYQI